MAMAIATPTGFRRFFSNPVVGIVGSIASVISIPLALLFYLQGREYRDVVYTLHPLRTVLAQSGRPSDLKVEFRGEVLTSDVVAVQIAIWNQGKASVKPEHVLVPLELKLTPSVPILEASVRKRSRDVTEFNVSSKAELLKQGQLPLTLRILEQNDGAIIQVVYAGSREAHVEIEGTVEGQGRPRNIGSGRRALSSEERLRRTRIIEQVMLWLSVVGLVVGTVAYVASKRARRTGRGLPPPWRWWPGLMGVVVGLLTGEIWFLFFLREPVPPFGF